MTTETTEVPNLIEASRVPSSESSSESSKSSGLSESSRLELKEYESEGGPKDDRKNESKDYSKEDPFSKWCKANLQADAPTIVVVEDDALSEFWIPYVPMMFVYNATDLSDADWKTHATNFYTNFATYGMEHLNILFHNVAIPEVFHVSKPEGVMLQEIDSLNEKTLQDCLQGITLCPEDWWGEAHRILYRQIASREE